MRKKASKESTLHGSPRRSFDFFSSSFSVSLFACLYLCLPLPPRHHCDAARATAHPRDRNLRDDLETTTTNTTIDLRARPRRPPAVSPPDPAISVTTNTAISSGSVPIATSTPVNLAAGPLSPPPLTLAAGQAQHRDEHPPGAGAAPTVKVTSYPAVLKGRSAASPPNPNLVPSGKVPPPVPPRGTGSSRTRSSEEHRAAGAASSTTSSVTSSRGDEAAIITRYRLHECSSSPHHHHQHQHHQHHHHHHHHLLPLTSDRSTRASTSTTANDVTSSTVTAATSNKATTATTTTTTTTISNALHALRHRRASTPNTHRVTTSHRDVCRRDVAGGRPMEPTRDWHDGQEFYEDDEFVSVEKVENAYFIKTSPHPFRPDRGVYRSDRSKGRLGEDREAGNRDASRKDRGGRAATKMDHLAKFTYFLNPGSRADLMNYRMSRKDKKHSETYYERMKRKQKDLETSITTITTMSYRQKSTENAKITSTKDAPVDEQTKRRISRFSVTKKDNALLRKIREKSRRKKRLAPKPFKKLSSGALSLAGSNEETKVREEGKSLPSEMSFQSDRNSQGDRQSTIKREQASSGQDCFVTNNKFVDEKKMNALSESASDERGNKRGGFKGIFPKSYHVESKKKEDRIVRERINRFNRQTDEKLEKRHESNEQAEKGNSKRMSPDKLPSTSGREATVSASLDNIRSGNSDVKSSVSEKVKSFETFRTSVRDEARESRREDTRPYSSEYFATVKQKFTSPTHQAKSVQEKTRTKSRMETSSIGPDHEKRAFKSLSSGHCNDLPFSPREFGSLVPNVSFLHTYRKTRSFT